MSYGNLAVDVVDEYKNCKILNPTIKDELIVIWKKHAQSSGLSKAFRCPKATFLGICSNGHVKGIPTICYSLAGKNALYGVTAINLLKASPSLATKTPIELWELVRTNLNKSSNLHIAKKHNQQMDVVLGLWKKGYIK